MLFTYVWKDCNEISYFIQLINAKNIVEMSKKYQLV